MLCWHGDPIRIPKPKASPADPLLSGRVQSMKRILEADPRTSRMRQLLERLKWERAEARWLLIAAVWGWMR